ncbi:MAG TPA: tetratricopeptide repeat protein [Gemmatimonadaceae bacterium]
MRSNLTLRRATAAVATVVVLTGCATATTSTARGGAITRPVDPGQRGARATLVRADSAYQAGAYPLAASLFEQIVSRESDPPSIAIFRLATLLSWDNRLDEANALYRRYIAKEPRDAEGRIALARTLAWGGHYAEAIATYDTLIATNQRTRDASMGRAQTLAWAGRLDEALAVYKVWVRDHPVDREAAMDYARALAWDGKLDEAEAMYSQLSRTGNAAATKGLARVIGWRGEFDRSERTWRRVLETDPQDPEALTGLAQVLSWQGRQSDAEAALELALQANPSYGDARTLLRWVQADLRPSLSVTGLGINDKDKNRSTVFSADYFARTLWNAGIGARYVGRMANFAAIDSRSDAGSIYARWQPASSSWQVRAEGGVTRHSTTFVAPAGSKRTIGSGALNISGNLGPTLRVGLGGARAPFDETALLIANGVISSEINGDAAIVLPARLTLSGGASHTRLTGGTRENTRNAYNSTLRWNYNRSWSLAIGGRQFGYDTSSVDGYFAPRRYTLGEVSGRTRVGGTLGWNADGEVGVGSQRIQLFGSSATTRATERGALSLGYRFDPAREVSVSGAYANVAGPAQSSSSEYYWYTFSLRARLGF